MKIAEPDNIKAGEQELINSIMEQLNSEIIGSIASGRLAVNNLEFRNGDMVIHENRIVYKMEFETSVSISVLFDREGNLIIEDEDSLDSPQIEEDVLPEEAEPTIAQEDAAEELEVAAEELEVAAEESEVAAEELEAAAEESEVAAEESEVDADDQMNLVLEKTREFWLQKSQDAIEPADTDSVENNDAMFQEVLQKNKDFWQEQAANI